MIRHTKFQVLVATALLLLGTAYSQEPYAQEGMGCTRGVWKMCCGGTMSTAKDGCKRAE
jgi:hypothetical protein